MSQSFLFSPFSKDNSSIAIEIKIMQYFFIDIKQRISLDIKVMKHVKLCHCILLLFQDISENKLGARGAEAVSDILLHNLNITRLRASGENIK